MEHIWTMLMHKILQNHLLCAFVANLKIGVIYALYLESFCNKNLAIRKVFAFCDSVVITILTPTFKISVLAFILEFLWILLFTVGMSTALWILPQFTFWKAPSEVRGTTCQATSASPCSVFFSRVTF